MIIFQENECARVKFVEKIQAWCTCACSAATDAERGCVRVRSLSYTAIHLLSRIWAGWVMTVAKQTVACESSSVIQMFSCKDGGQPSYTESFINFVYREQILVFFSPHAALSFFLSDVITFIIDTTVTKEAGSLCLGTSPPSPLFALLCLLGWLAKS